MGDEATGERKYNLLDLAKAYEAMGEVIAAHGGDLDAPEVVEALAAMDAAEGSIHRKIDAIREVINKLDSDAADRKAEGELRIKRAKALSGAADRLEQWAILGIEAAGLKRAGTIIPMSVCKNGGRVGVEWRRKDLPIPEEFRKEKVEYSIDHAKLDAYQLLHGGRLPDGFEAKERGKHLRPAVADTTVKKGAN